MSGAWSDYVTSMTRCVLSRPYKKAMTHEEAVEIMLHGDDRIRPEMFDPELISLFGRHHRQFEACFDCCPDADGSQSTAPERFRRVAVDTLQTGGTTSRWRGVTMLQSKTDYQNNATPRCFGTPPKIIERGIKSKNIKCYSLFNQSISSDRQGGPNWTPPELASTAGSPCF